MLETRGWQVARKHESPPPIFSPRLEDRPQPAGDTSPD